jgi:GntR family transcriptional regulator, sialic acid-inducible nan operon repressor
LLEQPAGVLHFEQLRLFLEESIARYAAIHADEQQIKDLQGALDANQREIPNARGFAETDVAFHRILMAIPRNPIFISVHQALVDWLISQHTPKADPPGNKRAFEGHRAVMNAILRNDPEAAGLAMRDHLMAARRRYAAPRHHQIKA